MCSSCKAIVVALVFRLIHSLEVLDELVPFCATAVDTIVVVLVFGLIHSLEVLDELVAFCATAVKTIVVIAVVIVCVIANVGLTTTVLNLMELVEGTVVCNSKEIADFR